jgi:hypothetical protein
LTHAKSRNHRSHCCNRQTLQPIDHFLVLKPSDSNLSEGQFPSRGRHCVNDSTCYSFKRSYQVSIPSRGRHCVNNTTGTYNGTVRGTFPSPLGEDVVSTSFSCIAIVLNQDVSIPSRGRRCVNTLYRHQVSCDLFPSPLGEDIVSTINMQASTACSNSLFPSPLGEDIVSTTGTGTYCNTSGFPSPLGEDIVSTCFVNKFREWYVNVSIPSRGRHCVNSTTSLLNCIF